eukprot:gnl/Dysnectes_brevis/3006_a3711_1151.p1 GENE.gnl/Dysnectes_brevis/3006_a3711_1151~~gnl/Dysnectes_brevis/3006_a3711_1151.p1  ORF type:complete len:523 (-),score=130.49 gnl/Dysnectes_brevis/3006_a3711_1151:118-1686(-)
MPHTTSKETSITERRPTKTPTDQPRPKKQQHRRESECKIYISSLPKEITEATLKELCQLVSEDCYRSLVSLKIVTDSYARCVGYAFLVFSNKEAATQARKQIPQIRPSYKTGMARVSRQQTKFDREFHKAMDPTNSNVYISNIPRSWSGEDLSRHCSPYGEIVQTRVLTRGGVSRGIGFVQFKEPGQALDAIHSLDGAQVPGSDRRLPSLSAKLADTPAQRKLRQQRFDSRFAAIAQGPPEDYQAPPPPGHLSQGASQGREGQPDMPQHRQQHRNGQGRGGVSGPRRTHTHGASANHYQAFKRTQSQPDPAVHTHLMGVGAHGAHNGQHGVMAGPVDMREVYLQHLGPDYALGAYQQLGHMPAPHTLFPQANVGNHSPGAPLQHAPVVQMRPHPQPAAGSMMPVSGVQAYPMFHQAYTFNGAVEPSVHDTGMSQGVGGFGAIVHPGQSLHPGSQSLQFRVEAEEIDDCDVDLEGGDTADASAGRLSQGPAPSGDAPWSSDGRQKPTGGESGALFGASRAPWE